MVYGPTIEPKRLYQQSNLQRSIDIETNHRHTLQTNKMLIDTAYSLVAITSHCAFVRLTFIGGVIHLHNEDYNIIANTHTTLNIIYAYKMYTATHNL